jgi:isocitrate/isopropylmalate dehydrogenase
MAHYRIAAIFGDGIDNEVMPADLRALAGAIARG